MERKVSNLRSGNQKGRADIASHNATGRIDIGLKPYLWFLSRLDHSHPAPGINTG
jgi:hypothetical protein